MQIGKACKLVLAVLLCLGISSSSRGADRGHLLELNKKAAGLARQRDWTALRGTLLEIREQTPGNLTPRWLLRMASVEAHLGNNAEALRWMREFGRMGLVHDVAQDPDLAHLATEQGFREVAEQLKKNQKQVSHATVACLIPQADLMPEDITYDGVRRAFVVTSIRHHGLYRLRLPSAAGQACTLEEIASPQPQAWPAMAVSYDHSQHVIWTTASALPGFTGVSEEDEGKTLLIARDDTTGGIRQQISANESGPAVLGDMMLSGDGTVYVTASIGGGIYRLDGRAAKPALEKICQGFSPQTPVLAADGKRLFVADYPMGIVVVDLSKPSATELNYLPHPHDVAVTGIDGLYLAGDSLIAVQNGTNPPRILRLRLNRDQTAIVSAEVLEKSSHSMDSNHAVVIGDSLYFLSNVGWDKVDDHGNLKAGEQFTNPALLSLHLGTQ